MTPKKPIYKKNQEQVQEVQSAIGLPCPVLLVGPARSFAAAALMMWPELAPAGVASSLAGAMVGPVHRAFSQHVQCAYLADVAEGTGAAHLSAEIQTLRKEAARFLDVVRRNGLESEAWRAMAYLAQANGVRVGDAL